MNQINFQVFMSIFFFILVDQPRIVNGNGERGISRLLEEELGPELESIDNGNAIKQNKKLLPDSFKRNASPLYPYNYTNLNSLFKTMMNQLQPWRLNMTTNFNEGKKIPLQRKKSSTVSTDTKWDIKLAPLKASEELSFKLLLPFQNLKNFREIDPTNLQRLEHATATMTACLSNERPSPVMNSLKPFHEIFTPLPLLYRAAPSLSNPSPPTQHINSSLLHPIIQPLFLLTNDSRKKIDFFRSSVDDLFPNMRSIQFTSQIQGSTTSNTLLTSKPWKPQYSREEKPQFVNSSDEGESCSVKYELPIYSGSMDPEHPSKYIPHFEQYSSFASKTENKIILGEFDVEVTTRCYGKVETKLVVLPLFMVSNCDCKNKSYKMYLGQPWYPSAEEFNAIILTKCPADKQENQNIRYPCISETRDVLEKGDDDSKLKTHSPVTGAFFLAASTPAKLLSYKENELTPGYVKNIVHQACKEENKLSTSMTTLTSILRDKYNNINKTKKKHKLIYHLSGFFPSTPNNLVKMTTRSKGGNLTESFIANAQSWLSFFPYLYRGMKLGNDEENDGGDWCPWLKGGGPITSIIKSFNENPFKLKHPP